MNKDAYINLIVEETGLSKAAATRLINRLVEETINTVAEGGRVQLTGFGSFEKRVRKERKGRNPQTGKALVLPERSVPAFKAGKLFKERVAEA